MADETKAPLDRAELRRLVEAEKGPANACAGQGAHMSTTDIENRRLREALDRLKRSYDALEASTRQQIDYWTEKLNAARDEGERLRAALDAERSEGRRWATGLAKIEAQRDRFIEENERLRARLEKAHAFWLVPGDYGPRIGIESRQQRDLSLKWVVTGEYPRTVLTKAGEWEREPQPSDRTDEFIAATRFDSLDAAWAAAESATAEQASEETGKS